MSQSESTRPVHSETITQWDDTADVIVIGYSISGVAAALGAFESGADVLAIERGGSSEGTCGGIFYLGGGTPMQKAAGYDDTVDDMKIFLRHALGPGVDEAKLDAYCTESTDHYEWLRASGIKFITEADPDDSLLAQPADDGFVHVGGQEYVGNGVLWTGGENAHPFRDLVPPVPRGHIPRDFASENPQEIFEGGPLKQLLSHANETGIRTRFNTAALRLIIDESDRVVGVQAKSDGAVLNLRARGGVVLTTGGFVYNDEMLARHAPQLVGLAKLGHGGQDGLGIQIGQSIGADVSHLGTNDVTLIMFPPISFSKGILLTPEGQRFINEDTYYGRLGDKTWNTYGGDAFLLVDEDIFQESSSLRPFIVSESLSELEEAAGFPEGSLAKTVAYYNENAKEGQDPEFHKESRWLTELKAPYALIDLRNEARAASTLVGVSFTQGGFTMGGLRTNEDSHVLRSDGSEIEGLFAAGRATSGLAVGGYCSGISLGDGTFFGRRAGKHAFSLVPESIGAQ